MIHPVIRIVSFLVLAGFVAFGGQYELALGFLIVLSIVLFKRLQSVELSLRILKRMRWFFLSIFVIYLWFTPGQPLIPVSIDYIPTMEGLQTGLLRVLSLVLIILAVNYFVSAIARNKLVEAIVWLLYPLTWLGIDNKLLALRIALVLELIPKVQHVVLDIKQHYVDNVGEAKPDTPSSKKRSMLLSRLALISRLVELLFERVIEQALRMPSEKIVVDTMVRPPMVQWLIPGVMVFVFYWIRIMAL